MCSTRASKAWLRQSYPAAKTVNKRLPDANF
jgi:hypothetical protein